MADIGTDHRVEPPLIILSCPADGDLLGDLVSRLPTNDAAHEFANFIITIMPPITSSIDDLLDHARSRTSMAIEVVNDVQPLRPGVIHVLSLERTPRLRNNRLEYLEDGANPLDTLLLSAAEIYGERVFLGLIAGVDGSGVIGARAVGAAGGAVLLQQSDEADHNHSTTIFPPSIIDQVVDLDALGDMLSDVIADTGPAEDEDERLRAFLAHLRTQSGIDFNEYKTKTIRRRLRSRMNAVGVENLNAYSRYLQRTPDEYNRLVSGFLVKVTEFFRDPAVFTYLRERVLPDLIAHAHGKELRIWSAGCATGEEAYSLAMMLAELVPTVDPTISVRLFATDLDNQAIAFARMGIYPSSMLGNVTEEQLRTHFTPVVEGGYEISKQLRSMVVFGQHDMGRRAPFPRMDMVLCRNVLIYFTTELQKRALQTFAFSLRDDGVLVLGATESITPVGEYFSTEQAQLKVFRRAGDRVMIPFTRNQELVPAPLPPLSVGRQPDASHGDGRRADYTVGATPRPFSLRAERVLHLIDVGAVVVDRRYTIQFINSAARELLSIHSSAIGDDLIHILSPELLAPLRPIIEATFHGESQAIARSVETRDVTSGDVRYLDFRCLVERADRNPMGGDSVILVIEDVTDTILLRIREALVAQGHAEETTTLRERVERLSGNNRQFLDANRELTQSNLELRAANDDLLVVNEEVQAATEELETLNEELQATNEELETLNEELQATVEELNTTNDDLNARSLELQQLALQLNEQRELSESERQRLEAILVGMGDAVVVVDPSGDIILSNSAWDTSPLASGASLLGEGDAPMLDGDRPLSRAARGEAFQVTFSTLDVTGTRRWYEAHGRPVESEGVRRCGVVVARDITDLSLRQLQEQFMAMVSHELRTPLTAVRIALQLLQRGLEADSVSDRTRRQAGVMESQVKRLSQQVGDLFDVARLQYATFTIETERLDVGPVLSRAVESIQLSTRSQVINLSLPDDSVFIEGDDGRLEQVLHNLLSNAVMYAPHTEQIDVSLQATDGVAMIIVRDFGPGVPISEQPYLFTRSSPMRPGDGMPQGGLGLGLFICREIIEAHQGTIELDGAADPGAAFVIRLPLAE